MSNQGYIYVLASSAHKELVKIGKTSRSPQDRANELSASTGVPVPFIVVWEELVGDIDACERLVHLALENLGVRPSSSREFFQITPTQAVKLIQSLKLEEAFPSVPSLGTDAGVDLGLDENPALSLYRDAFECAYGSTKCWQRRNSCRLFNWDGFPPISS
jgi:hypothetical protein